MFQIDLNSDRSTWLEEQVFVNIIWSGNARILNMPEFPEICPNVSQYASVCATFWIYLIMGWNNTCLNKPDFYAWICLNNVQNMHKLLLNNALIMCLKLTKYADGAKFAWIRHGFWIELNIQECINCSWIMP